MPAYRLTNKALEDLRSIARYTEQIWGREQRNKYLSKLDASFQMLVNEPELGRACDEIRQGYRKHHVGRHLVFYRLIATRIEIIRILHDSMDIDSHI